MPCCGQLVINDLCRNHLCPDWDGSVELFDPMDPHRPGSCPCSTPPAAFGDPPTHYEGDAPSDRDGRSESRQETVTAAQHPTPGPEAPKLMGPGTAAAVDGGTSMAEMLDSENAFQAIDTPAHSHSREGTWAPMESMPRDKYQSFLDSRPGQRGGPIDGSAAAERRDRGCGLPSGVRGGLQGGMRHRGTETADEVQCVDSDADEVLVPDDEGDSARIVGKVWKQDAVGFQHLRDA